MRFSFPNIPNQSRNIVQLSTFTCHCVGQDIGTGSGFLAMLAAKYGAKKVLSAMARGYGRQRGFPKAASFNKLHIVSDSFRLK